MTSAVAGEHEQSGAGSADPGAPAGEARGAAAELVEALEAQLVAGHVGLAELLGRALPGLAGVGPADWPEDLRLRLARLLRQARRRETAARQLETAASPRDALTAPPDRDSFRAHLDTALHYAQRREQHVALLLLDLDHFTEIDARLGARGAGLVDLLAQRISRVSRKSDRLERVGDDQFALMLQGRDLDFAPARTAERLLECFSEPFHVGGEAQVLTASIGIALHPRDAGDAESLIRNAASAVRQAAARGGNAYRFFGPAMSQGEERRLAISDRLRGAVGGGQLRLLFQPRIDGGSGRILGAEALLRWKDPELGFVPPGEFVPIAERMGMMAEIGAWVMHEACAAHREWCHAGFPALRLSVNVSAHQIESASLRDAVAASIARAGLSPGLLEIELTESALVDDDERAAQLLKEFAEVGISLALDDFGTGFSSLAHLRHFPVRTLKIDPSFVRAIRPGDPFPPFVDAILTLAASLGLEVVAEGVETPGQRAALLERGCRHMQGFLFSRPLPQREFLALLEMGGVLGVASEPRA